MKGTLLHYIFAILIYCFNKADAMELTSLINFQYAPFPLKESASAANQLFFDVNDQGRRGHQSLRAGVYWEDETYNDNRVLISIPEHFNPKQPSVIVVYLHGNQSMLERDVRDRQVIPAQISASGLNAVLVAPQFALDAQDSSPGNFSDNHFFQKFLSEVATKVNNLQKNRLSLDQLQNAPVVIVAYSGGYQAAASALENGGASDRVTGLILLDALYGRENIFADFILNNPNSFFVSTFTESSQAANEHLKSTLKNNGRQLTTELPETLNHKVVFMALNQEIDHYTLLERGWTQNPLADILRRVKIN